MCFLAVTQIFNNVFIDYTLLLSIYANRKIITVCNVQDSSTDEWFNVSMK